MSVCPVEYYAPIKGNEILINPTTWMDLQDIMSGEISQTQKVKYYI